MSSLGSSELHVKAAPVGPQVEFNAAPGRGPMAHVGLRVEWLPRDSDLVLEAAGLERLVVPLDGACTVRCAGTEEELRGRPNVFESATDFAYLPAGEAATINARGGPLRMAIPSALASGRFPFRVGKMEDVPVEVRGAGPARREIRNFCAADVFDAERLISVEVITPGGNWSSYPPHKHDVETADECELEEIYYFRIAQGRRHEGFGYQRVYSVGDRALDLLVEVRDRDAVLIPFGYHGPSMAAPGYDMYYLNAMAGPGDVRRWAFTDDPAHAWIRDTWTGEED